MHFRGEWDAFFFPRHPPESHRFWLELALSTASKNEAILQHDRLQLAKTLPPSLSLSMFLRQGRSVTEVARFTHFDRIISGEQRRTSDTYGTRNLRAL